MSEMILPLIVFFPLIAAMLLLAIRDECIVKHVALGSTLVSLALVAGLLASSSGTAFTVGWIHFLDIDFALGADNISRLMLLLNAILFPVVMLAGYKQHQAKASILYALLLLAQAALNGVFLAQNTFVFYVFWELSLIPLYFVLLVWGGEGKRHITVKFFIYTLLGSLLLLFGIIYLYQVVPGVHTTSFSAISNLTMPRDTQIWLFWVLFIAFAIKMPLFPFQTWQPSTYTMAPVQAVMVLAGIMTKMGIYGALRFIFPVVPMGVLYWQNLIIALSLIGMVYASVIAFRQKNLKTLIAFSSLAHISLMVAAMFALNAFAFEGLMFQVVSHGIVIVALFYIGLLIEERTGTLELDRMGGLKISAPRLALMFLMVMLGSVALPLTSGFIGELFILMGLFAHSMWVAAVGGLTMIFGAVYMLYAYQRAMLGNQGGNPNRLGDMQPVDYAVLVPLVCLVFFLGIYPQPLLQLIDLPVEAAKHLMISGIGMIR